MGSYKNRIVALLAVIWFCSPSFADQKDLLVNTFGGLNTQDSPAAIQPYESQDLLNVNLQVGLKSVFKRDGYGLFQGLPINTSTTAVHGGYHFQQTGGGDVQLWGNDIELAGSVNDGTFVKLATNTVSSTWQCTDNLGFAYCVNNSATDLPVKTDGTSANTTYQVGIPSGTMITNTPVRLVVAGISGNPSSIYFSQANTFNNFVPGPLTTDPFVEIINSPGSRLTHIAYYFGKVYWWKDQSFGYVDCTDASNQYNCSLTIVSNSVGTLDNSSAFWNGTTFESGANAFSSGASPYSSVGIIGGIFFRGQDNHIYVYDGYALTRLTRRITPTINSVNRKKANSWTQGTQANFQAGSIVPTANLSTTIQPGVVITSSFSTTENSSSKWNSGTNTNMTVSASSMAMTLNNSGMVTNPDFESSFSGNWATSGNFGINWIQDGTIVSLNCGNMVPQHGSFMAGMHTSSTDAGVHTFEILNNAGAVQESQTLTQNNDCTWRQNTLTPTSSETGMRIKVRLHWHDTSQNTDAYLSTSDSYIWGGPISYYYNSGYAPLIGNDKLVFIDNIQNGSSTVTSGSFTSQTYDTTFTSATYSLSDVEWINNTSTPTFDLQTASSTSPSATWTELLASSGTNAIGNRYVKYTTTITINGSQNAQTSISTFTIIAGSTGTYYSAVNNAPNLTSWGSLTQTDSTPGNSSIAYYVRSSTSTFTVLSSTPVWTAQPKNAIPVVSTGTWMQLRGDFSITAATETPNLDAFTFNWFEGSAADKMYMTYFQDYIWISVSSGTSVATNNRILRLDLLNNTWLLDDIASNGFAVENNVLYFGDPIQGRVFKFGGVPTDNGAAINAYWKSKDFTGDDPTVQNEFQRADFIFDVAATTVTYTITLDQNVMQAITTPLTLASSTSNQSIVKRGFYLSPGKIGTFYNFKIGDNSSNPRWRMLFHNLKYNPLYWKPQTF